MNIILSNAEVHAYRTPYVSTRYNSLLNSSLNGHVHTLYPLKFIFVFLFCSIVTTEKEPITVTTGPQAVCRQGQSCLVREFRCTRDRTITGRAERSKSHGAQSERRWTKSGKKL